MTQQTPDRLRLFVALALEPAQRDALAAWAAPAARDGWRLVAADNLHVTLVFIGGVPADELPGIAAASREAFVGVAEAAADPVRVERLGSVLAVRLGPSAPGGLDAIADAQARLAERLDRVEGRAWLPHVTVARARRGRRLPVPGVQPPALRLRLAEVAVYASRLHPSGARYESLASFPLGAA